MLPIRPDPGPAKESPERGDSKNFGFFAFASLPCLDFFWGKTGSKQKKVNPSSAESHRIKNI